MWNLGCKGFDPQHAEGNENAGQGFVNVKCDYLSAKVDGVGSVMLTGTPAVPTYPGGSYRQCEYTWFKDRTLSYD